MATPIPDNEARFSLAEILAATGGRLVAGNATTATSVTSDSRAVRPGSLFVALRGDLHDGHAFVAAAAKAGAAIALVERAVPAQGIAVVEVGDTLTAWGALAEVHLTRWRAADAARRVVAITGSAGKTTTKELTAALLAEVGPTHFTAGNLNNRVGVPAVVFALRDERFLVLEMGMSLPGELDAICAFARPDVGVVVNIGLAHSEGVGGREGVMHEKGAVYRALGPAGVAVVNADDDLVRRAAAEANARSVVTFGRAAGADVRLEARIPSLAGSNVVLTMQGTPARRLEAELPLPGEAPAVDLVAALAAAEAASGAPLGPETVARALGRVRLEGRGTIHDFGGVLVVDDTYNANPASMRSSLGTLGELAGGSRRQVAVLGEMRELGAFAEDEHRSLGDAIADAGVALAIGCGGLVDLALERARARGVEVVAAPDTDAAAAEAVRRIRPGDVVLVKASRGVRSERVVQALASARER